MKSLFFALSLFLFISCEKEILQPADDSSINAPVQSSDMTFNDSVWFLQTVKWKYNDTTAFMQQDSLTLFIGHSYFENMVNNNSALYWTWDPVFPALKAFNRGIGGRTWANGYPYLDSSARYKDRLRTVIIQYTTNDVSREIGKGNRDVLSTIRHDVYKYVNRAFELFPDAEIYIVKSIVCPKFYHRGYSGPINDINVFYDSLIQAKRAQGYLLTAIEMPASVSSGDMYYYQKDSIHPNNYGYFAMQPYLVNAIKNSRGKMPAVVVPPVDTIPDPVDTIPDNPPVDTTVNGWPIFVRPEPIGDRLHPIVNTGAPRFIPRVWMSTGWKPGVQATLSTAAQGAWIKSFKWSQYGGPVHVSFANANAGTTSLVYPTILPVGIYEFQVAVEDSRGNVNYGYTTITITD